MPWLFGIALFAMSILLYSQAATVRALMPLGIALGISPMILVALFPAVNGYFFIPNYPTVVAAINFDLSLESPTVCIFFQENPPSWSVGQPCGAILPFPCPQLDPSLHSGLE